MKKYKLAVTFGRFNLPHIGHLDLFKHMAEEATDIAIGISTGSSNLSVRDRTQTLSHMLNSDKDFRVPFIIVPKRQPFELISEIKQYDPSDVIFYLGQDQAELARAVEKYVGCHTQLIPRLTSSTAIRGMIDGEDWVILAKHVPMSIFNKVVQLRETERCLVSR